ncbi:recombinase family protein [Chondromyces crocatus]|uniref:recombinase family protein n=1 Tax=Chondromyces crocatus TaxID=52 RepID=UPI0012E0DF78
MWFSSTLPATYQKGEPQLRQVSNRPRAGLYCRVSNHDQRPKMQGPRAAAVGRTRRLEIVVEYVDCAVSGARERRPELDRLPSDVHPGGVDILSCWRFERLAPSLRHLISALDDFRERALH